MAGSYNKVLLMGNLTRDIEIKHTSNNNAVGNFGLAVNRKFKAGDGEWREEVTFVDCEVWGRTAENMSKYLHKGRPVFIEGRLKLDTWEDKNDGSKRSKMRVVVENFQFIDSGGGGGGGGSGGGGGYASSGARSSYSGGASSGSGGGGGGGGQSAPPPDDDIPF
jgi:single-strand DNA-binding protein